MHDEEEFCVTGDKVVIRHCRKLSSTKAYYVNRIIKPAARQNLSGEPLTQWEEDLYEHNRSLQEKPLKQWF